MLMELLGRQRPSSSTASTRDDPSSRRITTPQRGQTPLPYGARSQLGFGGHCLVGLGMKTVPTRVGIGKLQEHPAAPKFLPYNLFLAKPDCPSAWCTTCAFCQAAAVGLA